MGAEAAKYNNTDVAKACLEKAQELGLGADGHELYRSFGILILESQLLIEKGKLETARELLLQKIAAIKDLSKTERSAVVPELWNRMIAVGISPKYAQKLLNYSRPLSTQDRKQAMSTKLRPALAKLEHAELLMNLELNAYPLHELEAALELMSEVPKTDELKGREQLYTGCQLARAMILCRFGRLEESTKIIDSLPNKYVPTVQALNLALNLNDKPKAKQILDSCSSADDFLSCAFSFRTRGDCSEASDCIRRAFKLLDSLPSEKKSVLKFRHDTELARIFIETEKKNAARNVLAELFPKLNYGKHSLEIEDASNVLGLGILCDFDRQKLDQLALELQTREHQSSN